VNHKIIAANPTLRMTMLRDQVGTVHFVFHGTITRVSNGTWIASYCGGSRAELTSLHISATSNGCR
jgi:hypothetical protein